MCKVTAQQRPSIILSAPGFDSSLIGCTVAPGTMDATN